MDYNDLVLYVRMHSKVTVPQVQREFSLKYGEARAAFDKMEKDGLIKYMGGLTYEWCMTQPKIDEELVRKRREELERRLENIRKQRAEENHDDDDDEDDALDLLFKDLDTIDEDDDDDIAGIDELDEIINARTQPTKPQMTPAEIAEAITNKLAVFNIRLRLSAINSGQAFTQFVFDVTSPKTRISDIKQYAADIRACTESQYDVRIVAPLPGTRQVAVEIANSVKSIVSLDDAMKSDTFRKSKGKLDFVLGADLSKNVVVDLATLPHLLVAGTVGSGKSTVLSSMIMSLAKKYSPDYVKFLMVDTKFIDLSRFNGMPHMLTEQAITNHTDALAALDYLIEEMDRRYKTFISTGNWNIEEYNRKMPDKLPYLVFVVDELADIMECCRKDFEAKLTRLAQKSRACGIHIVLATQRPDVKTITGTIKANFPARIALRVASQFDSATIIGTPGAELLMGSGDMLYMGPAMLELQRLQGAYVHNDEIHSFVKELKNRYACRFDREVAEKIFASGKTTATQIVQKPTGEADPLCKRALRYWLEKQGGRASIASIQRNLGIGFNRAGRIMDYLQKLNYVEQQKETDPTSKPVRVLVTLEQLDELFPDQDD